jgi:uncharacterized protein
VAGTSVAVADVERSGLRGDRRWMVVDAAGTVVTARERHLLLSVTATPLDDDGVLLAAGGMPSLRVERPSGPPDVPVELSRLATATAAGRAADTWLSALLGEQVRLVWLDDPARRPVSPQHGGLTGDPLSLADAGPVLLTTTASLRQVQQWVEQECAERGEPAPGPLDMVRFRPNVVVDGDLEPFAEDAWRRLVIGEVTYRFAECCDRCVMTTIDPSTLRGGKEPLRALARHRRWGGKVWFGVRLVPTAAGRVAVGDEVRVVATAAGNRRPVPIS